MNATLRPVAFNEVSYNVALLHAALSALGLDISREETRTNRAGENTRAQVRALQERLHVQPDAAKLVDDATIAAVAEALQRRGLTSA